MDQKTIRMNRELYNDILNGAKEVFPEEACGLIAGVCIDGIFEIKKVYVLENTDHSSEHFSMNPQEQLVCVKNMRLSGFLPLGNWHSHPSTPSRPSEEDKRLAFDKKAIYMILSLAEEQPELNAFHIEGEQARKENLLITD